MVFTIVIVLVVVFIVLAIIVNRNAPDNGQKQLTEVLPTLEQYSSQYSSCKTENGMRCYICGSGQLQNKGIAGESDIQRVVSCVHCGTALYKLTGN